MKKTTLKSRESENQAAQQEQMLTLTNMQSKKKKIRFTDEEEEPQQNTLDNSMKQQQLQPFSQQSYSKQQQQQSYNDLDSSKIKEEKGPYLQVNNIKPFNQSQNESSNQVKSPQKLQPLPKLQDQLPKVYRFKTSKKARSNSPKLRSISPQQIKFFKNIRFLNCIEKPKNPDDDDSLYAIKNIYISNKKLKFLPERSASPQPNQTTTLTNDEQAYINFHNQYKHVTREQERNIIYNRKDNKVLGLLAPILDENMLPRKLGIVKLREEPDKVDVSFQKCGNQYSSAVSSAIKQYDYVKTITVRDNRLTESGIDSIVQQLTKETLEIDFSFNKVGIINLNNFVDLLSQQQYKLKILKMENTKLTDKHIEILVQGISNCQHLSILNLSKNEIQQKGCQHLEGTFQYLPEFKELYLKWNKINGDGAQVLLESIRRHGKLRVLDLSQNSIGINKSKFIDSLTKLIKSSTTKGILHMDISQNYFKREDGKQISAALKLNQSILGIHLSGHGWYISPKGFLKIDEKYQIDDIHLVPGIVKVIDGCRFTGYNEVRLRENVIDNKMNLYYGDNCWICEGWLEYRFEWTNESSTIKGIDELFLHLEIDSYKPCKMQSSHIQGCFFLKRMVPPKTKLRYYFSQDGSNKILIAKNLSQENLKVEIEGHFSKVRNQQEINEEQQKPPILSTINLVETGKFQQIIDNDFNVTITTQPRFKYQSQKKDAKDKLKKSLWSVNQSSFREFKIDDETLLQKCFDYDWECSKITSVIKAIDQQQAAKQILRNNYIFIKNAYRYYSFIQPVGEVPSINFQTFLEFIKQTNIIDDTKLKISDVELSFIACNSMSKFRKNPRKPDKALIRYQFMEIMVRLSDDKYVKQGIHSKIDDALDALLNEGYLYGLKRIETAQTWRYDNYWNEECDQCLKFYAPILKNVYRRYANLHVNKVYSSVKTLSIEEFREMITHTGLFANANDREVNACFGVSFMTSVDELNSDRHMQQQYIEFAESIARISDKFIFYNLANYKLLKSQEEQNRLIQDKKPNKSLSTSKGFENGDDNDSQESQNEEQNPEEQEEQIQLQVPVINKSLKLHYKIETMCYILWNNCCEDDVRDSFPFPQNSIFKDE